MTKTLRYKLNTGLWGSATAMNTEPHIRDSFRNVKVSGKWIASTKVVDNTTILVEIGGTELQVARVLERLNYKPVITVDDVGII